MGRDDPPAWNQEKVSLLDTDHIWGVGGTAPWVWRSFPRGHALPHDAQRRPLEGVAHACQSQRQWNRDLDSHAFAWRLKTCELERTGLEPVELMRNWKLLQGEHATIAGLPLFESRPRHCLDITLQEDRGRVRHPEGARVLGVIRRVVVSLANAAVNQARKKDPETECDTVAVQQQFRS